MMLNTDLLIHKHWKNVPITTNKQCEGTENDAKINSPGFDSYKETARSKQKG